MKKELECDSYEEMYEEMELDKKGEIRYIASNVWDLPFIKWDSPRSDVEPIANLYGLTYEQAMRYRSYWMKRLEK